MNKSLNKLHSYQLKILNFVDDICKKNNINYFLVGGSLLGAIRHKGFIPWDDDIDIAMTRRDFNKFCKIIDKYTSNYFIDYFFENKSYFLLFPKIREKNSIFLEKDLINYTGPKGIGIDIFILDYVRNEKQANFRFKLVSFIRKFLLLKNYRKINDCNKSFVKILYYIVKLISNSFLHILTIWIMKGNKKFRYFMNYGSKYGVKKQLHEVEKYFPAIEAEFEGKMYKIPKDYDYVLKKIYGNDYMQLPPEEKRVTHNPIKIKFEDGEEIIYEKGEK